MLNFTYYNPVKIVFGKGTITELPNLIPAENKVMMIYGGGSIKQNGVYDQVAKAMAGRPMAEFGGIEPNPRYETCMKCVESIRKQGSDFLLAVGGGSVLDADKIHRRRVLLQGRRSLGLHERCEPSSDGGLAPGQRADAAGDGFGNE